MQVSVKDDAVFISQVSNNNTTALIVVFVNDGKRQTHFENGFESRFNSDFTI